MNYADSLLDRYAKVSNLAARGMDGERANAARMKARMEGQYPGIAYESNLRDRNQEPEPPTLDGNFGGAAARDSGPRWQDFGKMAESAFRWAAGAAEQAAGSEYARRCAETFCEIRTKNLASAKRQISVRMPLRDLYNCAEGLNPMQKVAFSQWVGEQVAAEMLEALESYEDEP